MGLIDFIKDKGREIFGGDKDGTSENRLEGSIKDSISTKSVNIKDLDIDVRDGVATLRGTANSQAEKELAVLLAGNTSGIQRVDDRLQVTNPGKESTFYTVVSGDSLSKIADRYYGDPMQYPKIFEANRGILDDPNKIYPGQTLRIPQPE